MAANLDADSQRLLLKEARRRPLRVGKVFRCGDRDESSFPEGDVVNREVYKAFITPI
jgi:hypothetical protein